MGDTTRASVTIYLDTDSKDLKKIEKFIKMANNNKLAGEYEGHYYILYQKYEGYITLDVEGGRYNHCQWQIDMIGKFVEPLSSVTSMEIGDAWMQTYMEGGFEKAIKNDEN